jgi:hypothetical protein
LLTCAAQSSQRQAVRPLAQPNVFDALSIANCAVWEGLRLAKAHATTRHSLADLSRRQQVILGALGLALIVVVAATVLVVSMPEPNVTGGTAPGTTPAPTAPMQPLTLSALAPPAPISAPPGQWTAAGPGFAQAITFAASAPSTGLACGSAGRHGQMALALTNDGGTTWMAQATSLTGQACAVSIAPTQPKDMVLAVAHCAATCGPTDPAALYRSADGGATWAQATLPQGSFGLVLGWDGTTLCATTNMPTQPLAVSLAGGAFMVQADIARFPGTIVHLGAANGTIFAILQTAPTAPVLVVQSHTNGAIWTGVNFTDGTLPVDFAGTSADGTRLFGLENEVVFVISRDGGQTWAPLDAAFPAGETLAQPPFVVAAPDGMLVVQLATANVSAPTTELALYTPGSGWQSLAALPAHVQPLALSWNGRGQASALWAASTDPTTNQALWLDHF